MKDLESAVQCAQSTMVGLVSRLEKKGLVTCFADERDRRIKHVRVTEAGSAQCERCLEQIREEEAMLSSGLNEEEQEQLMSLLARVYQVVRDRSSSLSQMVRMWH